MVANYKACQAAGWNKDECELMVSTHVTAVVVRAIDARGEVVVVDDLDISNMSEEIKMVEKFPSLSSRGLLMCAAGALNHFAINHTTGQECLQGFTINVAHVLGLKHLSMS